MVTINTNETGVSFSTVVDDLNAIYNTMNVSWQQGKHIVLNIAFEKDELNDIKKNEDAQKQILSVLKNRPDYKPNQYYMITLPTSDNFGGFADPSLIDNYFLYKRNMT